MFRLNGKSYTRNAFYNLLRNKGQTRTLSSLPIRYQKWISREYKSMQGVIYRTKSGNIWAVVHDMEG